MGITALKCTNCGANIELEEEQEIGFCKYCGTKIIREEANTQKIKIDGKVDVVNTEFETKLATADNLATSFLKYTEMANVLDYNKVALAYSEAEKIGANEGRIYLHTLDFFVKANLVEDKVFFELNTEKFADRYDEYLQLALKYENDINKKNQIKTQYQDNRDENIEKFNLKVKKYNEKRNEKSKNKKIILLIVSIILIIYFSFSEDDEVRVVGIWCVVGAILLYGYIKGMKKITDKISNIINGRK